VAAFAQPDTVAGKSGCVGEFGEVAGFLLPGWSCMGECGSVVAHVRSAVRLGALEM
jgi:hypothetical protein